MKPRISVIPIVIMVACFGLYLFATIGPLGQYLAQRGSVQQIESTSVEQRPVMESQMSVVEAEVVEFPRVELDQALETVRQSRGTEAVERNNEAQQRLREAIRRGEEILEEEANAEEEEVEEALPESLSRHDVQKVVRGETDRIRRCARAHNSDGESGHAIVRFVVEEDGSVSSASVQGGYANTDQGDCIESVVGTFQFPETQESRTVSYPFLTR